MGRGEGWTSKPCNEVIGRAAATPVHSAHGCFAAGGYLNGRAMFCPGPFEYIKDRGTDHQIEKGLYDSDRDPQHAAGSASGR